MSKNNYKNKSKSKHCFGKGQGRLSKKEYENMYGKKPEKSDEEIQEELNIIAENNQQLEFHITHNSNNRTIGHDSYPENLKITKTKYNNAHVYRREPYCNSCGSKDITNFFTRTGIIKFVE